MTSLEKARKIVKEYARSRYSELVLLENIYKALDEQIKKDAEIVQREEERYLSGDHKNAICGKLRRQILSQLGEA